VGLGGAAGKIGVPAVRRERHGEAGARVPEHALGGCFQGPAYAGPTTSSRTMTAFLRASVPAAARPTTAEFTLILNQISDSSSQRASWHRRSIAPRVPRWWTGAASTCSTTRKAPSTRRRTTSRRSACVAKRLAEGSRSRRRGIGDFPSRSTWRGAASSRHRAPTHRVQPDPWGQGAFLPGEKARTRARRVAGVVGVGRSGRDGAALAA